ncbi:uncharacterized protein LOC142802636 [Rhipicephalus microplus]|uniref:uncharacterized protein LOC142802636 n=1 Tax=Rhipicephalus microplus TaxID=6941 RepID=UPI003F6C02E0
MVSASFVMTVCFICGALNCSYIGNSLLVLIEGQEMAPNGFIFRFVYIVVSGMSLCADIMLYTAVSSGTNPQQQNASGGDGVPGKIIKKMKVALCVKLFVIAMDFFTPPMHNYNCCQDVSVGETCASTFRLIVTINFSSSYSTGIQWKSPDT